MKDNHNAAWDAANEFKSATASATSPHRAGLTGRARKPTVAANKLLPTDAADKWQLLGIVKAVKKKGELPLCT